MNRQIIFVTVLAFMAVVLPGAVTEIYAVVIPSDVLCDAVEHYVIEAEGNAKAIVIEANAEAEALELIAEALKLNPDLLTFEYIKKLSAGIQVMLVPNDNPYLLPLPSLETGGIIP